MTAMTDRKFSALVGSIYDCALDASLWPQVLGTVSQALNCERAILSLNDLQRNLVLLKQTVGWEPFWLDERERHLPEIHSALAFWLGRNPAPDRPFVATREIPASQLQASPYMRQCLRPQGIADVAHLFLICTPNHFSELVLCWQEEHGAMTNEEIHLAEMLLPHLRRAVTISHVLDIRTIERAQMTAALDMLRYGVFLVNETGNVLHANRAAEEMLRNGEPLQMRAGSLHAKSIAADRELRRAIALSAQDEVEIGKTGIAIRLGDACISPLFAHVLPMNGQGSRRRGFLHSTMAAVFVDVQNKQSGADMLASIYGLTSAETRLLANLLAGQTLQEAADTLGIAKTTNPSW